MQRRFDRILPELMKNNPGPVLLAVSGGIDSMCMADLFLHSSCSPDFALAHCNFHLRGAESDSDEALVAEWAEKHGVRLYKKDFDTLSYASEHGLSIEMAARELRYRWFGELASVNGYTAVAVAHNANDNAETLILNMLRGTGIKGVTGMGELSANPYCQGIIIRPLLHFTRKQIEGHVLAHGLGYHEDSTNADVEYRRNRIRNQIFPLFSGINPSFVKTLNREMDYFSQAADIADEYFREHSSCMTVCPENGGVVCRVDVAALKSERHWKYILYRILEQYGFNSASVHSVCVLLEEAGTVNPGRLFQTVRNTVYKIIPYQDNIKCVHHQVRHYQRPQSILDSPDPHIAVICGNQTSVKEHGKDQKKTDDLHSGHMLFTDSVCKEDGDKQAGRGSDRSYDKCHDICPSDQRPLHYDILVSRKAPLSRKKCKSVHSSPAIIRKGSNHQKNKRQDSTGSKDNTDSICYNLCNVIFSCFHNDSLL